MKKERIVPYLIVGVLVIGFILIFTKVFSFEHKEGIEEVNAYYPKIDDAFIEELYHTIPDHDIEGMTTMYSFEYTKFSNMSYSAILRIVYNYMIEKSELNLAKLTKEDLLNQNITEEVTPLYKIPLKEFEEIGTLLFGSDEKLPRIDFTISSTIEAKYIIDVGYYVYENAEAKKLSEDIVERVLDKYTITNNGNTILIYDFYIKCENDSTKCYNDEKRTIPNTYIKNENGSISLKNRLSNAQEYMHTFKFENDHYYWYSSERIKK